MEGDLDGLLEMLSADAVAYAEGGGVAPASRRPDDQVQTISAVANPEKLWHIGERSDEFACVCVESLRPSNRVRQIGHPLGDG